MNIVEYYGLTGNPEYNNSMIKKCAIFNQNSLEVLPVHQTHIDNGLESYLVGNISHILNKRQGIFANKFLGYRQ